MKFRTEIDLKKELDLKPDFKLFTIGSCFADRMGHYFHSLGLESCLNPFGVIYNPISISKLLMSTFEQTSIGDWEQQEGLWLNTMYHGQFSHSEKAEAINNLERVIESSYQSYLKANLLIITLGTSYAYIDVKTNEVVTNCHRLPAQRFKRELLSISEMQSQLHNAIEKSLDVNPDLRIVLTVSPVRHVRDSLVNNQLSKAQLICVAHNIVDELSQVHYFPSYEILMDDLRDYRYYDEGLVQPNSQALTYIQEKFRQFAFSEQMLTYEKDATKLLKKLSHRPINQTEQTEQFKVKIEEELKSFLARYPTSKLATNL